MKNAKSLCWGIVLLIVGLILALNALNLIDFDLFFKGWWTFFIIIPALIGFIVDDDKLCHAIFLIVGLLLFLETRDLIDFTLIWNLIVPIIIILIGLSLIFRNMFVKDENKHVFKKNDGSTLAIFSGQELNYDNKEFNGTDLVAVFGGIDLDLRKAKLKKDISINGVAVFGGIDIFVPEDVNVEVKSFSAFGGVESNKKKNEKDAKITIYVNATCIFGGIEIKK